MEGALNGWTKSETMFIIESLSKVDFDELVKKIPTKNRKEIKEAVLFSVSILAEEYPKKSEQKMTNKEWEEFIINNHKTGEFNLPPPGLAIPYFMKIVTCLKGLFHNIGNAYEGKPVAPDSAIIEILRFLSSDMQALYDFCGGEAFSDIQKYSTVIDTSAAFLPSMPAPKHQQKKEKKMKEIRNASATPSMNPTANNNHTSNFAPASAYPPKYTPASQNIPKYVNDAHVSNVNPPMYASVSRTQQPMYAPASTNITTIYGPAINTSPTKIDYPLATKSNIPSMNLPATYNSMYQPAINHILPPPVYETANNYLQPPTNVISNQLLPPVYTPASQVNVKIQPATNYVPPPPVYESAYNYLQTPIYAVANNLPHPVYTPASQVNVKIQPASNYVPPTPVYESANNYLHPPINSIANNNLQHPVYIPASQTQSMLTAPINNYYQPAVKATATGQYDLIKAPANNFNSMYGPAQNNSYNFTNANIMPSYVVACAPLNVPAGSSRLEPPSQHAGNETHQAAPNRQ